MTQTQKRLIDATYKLDTFECLEFFVQTQFPERARRRTLTAMYFQPMDSDIIDYQGVVDYCIRKHIR